MEKQLFNQEIYDAIIFDSIDISSDKYKDGLEILKNGLADMNITISEMQIKQLVMFFEMLVEKNKGMNLTGIVEFNEVIVKHFLDSVALVNIIDKEILDKEINIIDVGTGAGFPGVPLKIVFPKIKITLLDSLNKRLVFLNEVIDRLKLENVNTVHGRCEELERNELYREKYDLCVSRAVANLATLNELCLAFVKVSGSFVSYKAGGSDEEITNAANSIKLMGGKLDEIKEFTLVESDLSRVFVKISKEKNTPKKYPRKPGVPGKEPL